MTPLVVWKKEDISIIDNWIAIKDVGKIGMYSPSKKAILLDYSLKWLIGTNEDIICEYKEIRDKIFSLFNNKI